MKTTDLFQEKREVLEIEDVGFLVVVLLVVDVAHLEHFVAGPIISTGKDRMELSCIIYTKWFSPSDGNISVDLEVVGDGGQVLQALIRTQHHGKMVVQACWREH